MNSAQITLNKINRQINQEMYTNFYGVEIDLDLLNERKNVILGAMKNISNESDCEKIACALAVIWDNDIPTIHIICESIKNSF